MKYVTNPSNTYEGYEIMSDLQLGLTILIVAWLTVSILYFLMTTNANMIYRYKTAEERRRAIFKAVVNSLGLPLSLLLIGFLWLTSDTKET